METHDDPDDTQEIQIWTDGRGRIVRANCWGGERDFLIILQLHALRELRLSNREMDDHTLGRLAQSPSASTLLRLDIAQTGITGAGYRYLASFPSLEALICNSPAAPEIALQHISRLRGLRRLTISGTWPAPQAWAHLGELHRLEEFVSLSTSLGDVGMAALAKLPNLRRLELGENGITDAGLRHLRNAKRLESICMTDPAITDKGLLELSRIASLQRVSVASKGIKGSALVSLRCLENLTLLYLGHTDVDDSAVSELIKFRGLERLVLYDTKISQDGERRLRVALPHCSISWSFRSDPPLEGSSSEPP